MTHTYAIMLVPKEVWEIIAQKMRDASYDHVFMEEDIIDMQGIGIQKEPE